MRNLGFVIVAGLAALASTRGWCNVPPHCPGQVDCNGDGSECAPKKDCCPKNRAAAKRACGGVACDSCAGTLDYDKALKEQLKRAQAVQDGTDAAQAQASNGSPDDVAMKDAAAAAPKADDAPATAKSADYPDKIPDDAKQLTKTTYGYPDDPDGDSNTRAGIGTRNMRLAPGDVALPQSFARSEGLTPGDYVWVCDNGGGCGRYRYADTVPNSRSIDFYNPNTSQSSVNRDPTNGKKYRVFPADN
ncbi:MAG: hypothetical protein NTX64_13725 [Elusimicrobia bacterium]|nr:hypothetical protein [Elusimicrobiota bacterium]